MSEPIDFASPEDAAERFAQGAVPMVSALAAMAGRIQSIGLAAEESGAPTVPMAHEDVAYIVRTLQTLSGVVAEMARIIEVQAQEARYRRIMPDVPKIIRH